LLEEEEVEVSGSCCSVVLVVLVTYTPCFLRRVVGAVRAHVVALSIYYSDKKKQKKIDAEHSAFDTNFSACWNCRCRLVSALR